MIVEDINNSFLVYNPDDHRMIDGFYIHCSNLLRKCLYNNNFKLNVVLGKYNFNGNNTNKTVKIDIQCEHTLVKLGGRSVQAVEYGTVRHEDGCYLIRIDNFDYFNNIDCVIEYSLANIYNISTNEKFDEYIKKVAYVSSSYYDINFDNTLKTDIITMFVDSNNPRRTKILHEMEQLNIPNKKIENCYNSCLLNEVYKKTKIMVNVHQTDHHHTFEELRVLPAVTTGVLVVSERVPLAEVIPYKDYIIWADYKDIASVAHDVMNNYEYYYNNFFVKGNLRKIINSMKSHDETAFNNILARY